MSKSLSFFGKIKDRLAASYQRMVAAELNKYGLRIEDLYVEDDRVKKALERLPPEERIARERRIKRAIEISMKKKYLPEEIQKIQTPFKPFMQGALSEVDTEEAERKALNS